jgi:small-conductance mechanosensitive channel
MVEQVLHAVRGWLWPAVVLAAAVLFGLVLHYIVFAVARYAAQRIHSRVDESLIRRVCKPARVMFVFAMVLVVLPALALSEGTLALIRHAASIAMIGATGWLAAELVKALEDAIAARYRIDQRDNLAARRIRTQTHLVRRIALVVIGVTTLALMLMTFSSIRAIGTALLASAGIAGLVAGIAARPLLANLIAGVQIALTEPIRIDDVVIVEGEWGWIEEIGTTYVVVRIWDLRRLVVPLSYFLERPFQNWTRVTADLLGTVFVYADYTVPVEEVRQELRRILESSGMWDGKVCGLQVTNATERTVELRALMSAPDSGRAWDLRCHVREKLIGFLQQRYPQSLPRSRVALGDRLPDDCRAGPPTRRPAGQ